MIAAFDLPVVSSGCILLTAIVRTGNSPTHMIHPEVDFRSIPFFVFFVRFFYGICFRHKSTAADETVRGGACEDYQFDFFASSDAIAFNSCSNTSAKR